MPANRVRRIEPEGPFPFWSPGELMRVGMIGTVALCPLLMTTLHAPAENARLERSPAPQPGRLLAVRVVDLNLGALTPETLGDAGELK